jgi:serine/threonine protein kinase
MSAESVREWPWFLPSTRQIAGFTVLTVLRSAGKTITLRVQDVDGRPYAMKIPVQENAEDPTWAARFDREVQILRQLSGPAFPQLRAFGSYDAPRLEKIPYIVTTVPIGPTLREIVAQRKATTARPDAEGAPYLLKALGAALSEVHEKGIVHRNLRPDKIAVSAGAVQLLDFVLGLSGALDDLTLASEFLGTPDYIAPEQVRSPHNVDARADLYALGLILYEYVTYDRPFGPVASKVEAFLKHLTEDPTPPSQLNPDIPKDLERVILKLLRRERAERFQSADELVEHVDEMLQARRAAALSHVCLLPEAGLIDGYRICEALSSVGKTTILRVEDSRGRPFALRLPSRQSAGDEKLRGRFEREIRILRQVAGPGYPHLRSSGTYAAGGHASIPYIVTDLPFGLTLREIIDARMARQAPPDAEGCAQLMRKLALLLIELHERSIFPCTLRPDNVAVSEGEVQLLEFVLGQGPTDSSFAVSSSNVPVAYHAPEQLKEGQPVDARADLYSLGVVLYEYLTYELPHGAMSSRSEALLRRMTSDPLPPSALTPSVPAALDAVVMRLLQPTPGDRYPDAVAVLAEATKLVSQQAALTAALGGP